jgi:hypothetical protein
VERLARHFERLVRSAVADPDRSVAELRMVEETKRRSRRVAAAGIDLEAPGAGPVAGPGPDGQGT